MAKIGTIIVDVNALLDGKPVDVNELRRALGTSNPCEVCSNTAPISAYITAYEDYPVDVNYCPSCGRRLKKLVSG